MLQHPSWHLCFAFCRTVMEWNQWSWCWVIIYTPTLFNQVLQDVFQYVWSQNCSSFMLFYESCTLGCDIMYRWREQKQSGNVCMFNNDNGGAGSLESTSLVCISTEQCLHSTWSLCNTEHARQLVPFTWWPPWLPWFRLTLLPGRIFHTLIMGQTHSLSILYSCVHVFIIMKELPRILLFSMSTTNF